MSKKNTTCIDNVPEQKDLHHVHFEENEDVFEKNNEIIVNKISDYRISAHIGFIQLNHRYSIEFYVPKFFVNTKNKPVRVKDPPIPNKHFKVVSAEADPDKICFKVELLAHKEKLLKEEFSFTTNDDEVTYFVLVVARVLGKGKGTPLLKNEVHCIEHVHEDDDSEASDWQGFN